MGTSGRTMDLVQPSKQSDSSLRQSACHLPRRFGGNSGDVLFFLEYPLKNG